tara:strand:- start:5720 stop:7957 length:2238 start_codon:yes stop_codon:yes gene_type:complete
MLTPDELLAAIEAKVGHPATVHEILKGLKLPGSQRATLRRRLAKLVERGELIKIRGQRYGLPERMHLLTGRVQVHPKGFGFVKGEDSGNEVERDLYIAGSNLNQAMHGDRVVARVERRNLSRVEGRIVRVIERGATGLVGRYEPNSNGFGYVMPFDRRFLMDVHIAAGDAGSAEAGDMVEVEITTFPTQTRSPVGRVVRVLGQIEDEGVDTQLILKKYGIPDAHEQDAIDEAVRLGDKVRPRDRRGRKDFRDLLTVTIDGESARDFDDAITISRSDNGNFLLGVHIADVSHYVAEGSVLDRAAYIRSTSVYFPDRAVHMFPAELSTGLCSLKPKVDRLVQSCVMEIDPDGEVKRYEIHDGVICSNERMTYADVDAILTQRTSGLRKKYSGFVCMFEMMQDLFRALRGRREIRGSIDFDLPAARFELDEAGDVMAIVPEERTIAHRLIEEFMLVANETVAAELNARNIPTLYRVHEEPAPLKVEEFEGFVTSLGYSLAAGSGSITPGHFQRLLERVADQPERRPITSLMLRAMQQARYDHVNKGHFGLAARFYTHFTSPIRRYPDLLVHRALRCREESKLTGRQRRKWTELLPEAARCTSERERRAEEAERELIQWKKVRFMEDKVGDEFTGHITGVTAFGLFVELTEQFVEGLVHISSMADDYYRFVETQYLLKGENSGNVYRLGDVVHVQLVRVDKEHRQLDLGLVDVLRSVRKSSDGRGVRSKKIHQKHRGRSVNSRMRKGRR